MGLLRSTKANRFSPMRRSDGLSGCFLLRRDDSGRMDEGFVAGAREETVNSDNPVDTSVAHEMLDADSESFESFSAEQEG